MSDKHRNGSTVVDDDEAEGDVKVTMAMAMAGRRSEERKAPPGISIRPCRPHDAAALQKAHNALFPIAYGARFFDAVARGTIHSLCAVDGRGVLVGFLVWRPRYIASLDEEDRNLVATLTRREEEEFFAVYIMTFGVLEAYQRQGIGGLLIHALFRSEDVLSPHCKAVFLHVLASNIQAIRFYTKRMGFHGHAYLPRYYSSIGGQGDRDAMTLVKYVNGGERETSSVIASFVKFLEGFCFS